MNWITYFFPLVTLILIIIFFSLMPPLKTAELNVSEKRGFSRRDLLILCLILIVYSAVGFYKLGDKEAPQSFYEFKSGESIVLDLGSEQTVGSFFYYTGLNTGTYSLEYSHDGVDFYSVASIEQDSGSLFKWETAELIDGADANCRYIRLFAHGNTYLGEIAIKDPDGELISYTCPIAQLCDEQELVPSYQHYMNSTYFDEIYHARTALEHIESVYPYEVSHPPLGKLIIAVGIKLFGMTPFGWRFSGTLFGVLMLPVLYVLLKKMFGTEFIPTCGTLIFAFDFMHYTQTRIATIDTYAVFFMLCMYLFMYLYITGGRLRHLALSGVFFGIGAAAKWTCIYSGVGLAVIWLGYWVTELLKTRRLRLEAALESEPEMPDVETGKVNTEGKSFSDFFKNCLFCLVFFVIIPAIIYYLSYFAYGTAQGMSAPEMFFSKEYAQTVLENQRFMFTYHVGVNAAHPYSSRWYMWIFDIRPILYYLQYFDDGTRSSFGAFLNPALCWGGLIAMFVMGYLALVRRDKLSAFILIGYLAQLLPWVFITRITFEYHYFQASVFLLLALCRIFSLMYENSDSYRRAGAFGFTGLCLLLFIMFYPVLSGKTTNAQLATTLLRWLPSWPF